VEVIIRDSNGTEHRTTVDLDTTDLVQTTDLSGHDLALLIGLREAFCQAVDTIERRLGTKPRTAELRKNQRRKF
jgi:hypothetical protein